ncbi:MAG: hypothetical protein COB02_10090 [Candidatus Cloacimonadota bacterium]|nr:MAG: hypothetical protein COB02_10090 [Candidatus Cloacimonadota bacterium]
MKNSGFSFVEILLAAVLSAMVIAPLSYIMTQSRAQTQASFDEVRATFYAREIIDQIQTMKDFIGFDKMQYISTYQKSAPYLDLDKKSDIHLYANPKDNKINTCSGSRLFLTPVGGNGKENYFKRLLKIYPANQGSENSYRPNPDNLIAEALIEWKSFGSTTFNRQLTLFAHLSRNELSPNSLQ